MNESLHWAGLMAAMTTAFATGTAFSALEQFVSTREIDYLKVLSLWRLNVIDRAVSIKLSLQRATLSPSDIWNLVNQLLVFQPTTVLYKATMDRELKFTPKRLKELEDDFKDDKFYVEFAGERIENSKKYAALGIVNTLESAQTFMIRATFSQDIIADPSNDVFKTLDRLAESGALICGFMHSTEDSFWQNIDDTYTYETYGKSYAGLPIGEEIIPGMYRIDTTIMPGYLQQSGNIWCGSNWKMWFGKEYFKYISRQKVLEFEKYFEMNILKNDAVQVTLYQDINDYDVPENREIQNEFKNQIDVLGTLEKIDKLVEQATPPEVPTELEIEKGNFPHGGTERDRRYYDDAGNKVPEGPDVVSVLLREWKDGELIWQGFEDYTPKEEYPSDEEEE